MALIRSTTQEEVTLLSLIHPDLFQNLVCISSGFWQDFFRSQIQSKTVSKVIREKTQLFFFFFFSNENTLVSKGWTTYLENSKGEERYRTDSEQL